MNLGSNEKAARDLEHTNMEMNWQLDFDENFKDTAKVIRTDGWGRSHTFIP